MKKIWMRLGGEISATDEQAGKILCGKKDALIEAVKENGFLVNGETYIPGHDLDADFTFNPGELVLQPKSAGMMVDDDIDVKTLNRLISVHDSFDTECRNLFIKKAKAYIDGHPELKGHKIWFDPDNTFIGEKATKYSGAWVGDVRAVGFSEEGDIRYDISTDFDLLTDCPSSSEVSYGVYVDDWPLALKVLLEHIESPYEPDED